MLHLISQKFISRTRVRDVRHIQKGIASLLRVLNGPLYVSLVF
jgi:hypothetical protein